MNEASATFTRSTRIFSFAALFSFAVAQPLADLLARAPQFLVAHRLSPGEVVALSALLFLGGPFLYGLLDLVLGRISGRWADRLSLVLVALLAALFALQLLDRLGRLPGLLLVALGCAGGVIFSWAFRRFGPVRSFVLLLSPGVILFPALLLLRPPVSRLVHPQDVSRTGVEAVRSTTPVVFLLFDELPVSTLMTEELQVDAAHFPAFARLAAGSTWFRSATTVAESTETAVPALLTGRYPAEPRLPIASDYPANLFTWLGTSYEMDVFESLARLCPEEICAQRSDTVGPAGRLAATLDDLRAVYLHLIVPRDLAVGLPSVSTTWGDFRAGVARDAAASPAATASSPGPGNDVAAQFATFVEGLHLAPRTALHFIHANLPHLPWKYLPSGQGYGPLGASLTPFGLLGEGWIDDEWCTTQAYQRHLLQAMYTDRLLGQALDRLEQSGLWNSALVVVVADHGVSFWPGAGRRAVGPRTAGDILRVPMFVRLPSQRQGGIDDRPATTLDLLPTIAAVLGTPLPFPSDGRSLLAPPETAATPATYLGTGPDGRFQKLRVDAAGPGSLLPTIRRRSALLGKPGDPGAIYRIGPFPEILGREVRTLSVSDSPLEVEISDARSLRDVRPAGPYLPAHVVGALAPAAAAARRLALAIAVDGIVRATTWSWPARLGAPGFSALIPPEALREGRNDLEVFEIEDAAQGRLARLRDRSAATYALERNPEGEVVAISSSDGTRIRLVPRAIEGEVSLNRDLWIYSGWGASSRPPGRAERVLVFRGEEFVTSVPTGLPRPDLVDLLGRMELADSGFVFVIPPAGAGGGGDPFAFYAASGDHATRLTETPVNAGGFGDSAWSVFYLRGANSGGPHDLRFSFGHASNTPLAGDWDGDGTDTVGGRRGRRVLLRNANRAGKHNLAFDLGEDGDLPVVGDWDGDGRDTVGYRRGNVFHLRDANDDSAGEHVFAFGQPADDAFAGDWDGDGRDTVGVRHGTTFTLTNSQDGSTRDVTFSYGLPGDVVIVGDWDGDGRDTIGVRRGNVFYLSNSLGASGHDLSFSYGLPTDRPIAGDWNGDGMDTVGVVRAGARPLADWKLGDSALP